ncbi:MAG TPA: hypothetical protein G4O02_17535 [Caldilineae bacterium]|nr:hypothetical protein [Caldilineae bacterium]
MEEIDLIVLVADMDAYWAIRTLLEKRHRSLGIRRDIQFEIVRHPQRDSGVLLHAHEFLRQYLNRAEHALVILDREGSGRDQCLAEDLEREIEDRLVRNGWPSDRVAAIVLDPELEVWVWTRSPHVARVIGLNVDALQAVLDSEPARPDGKPQHPKEALEKALRRSGRPFSARIFQELAENVSLRASERAFDKFKYTLQGWFPPEREG